MPLFGPPNIEKLKAKRDIPALINALSYKRNEWIRINAASALGDFGDRSAVEGLIAALGDPWHGVRKAAAQALGKLGGPRAVVPLIQLLKEGEEDDREAAVSALGKIGDARVVEALGAALKDPGRKVHLAAIRALGKIYDSQALRLLVSELKRPAMDMHDAAQMALVENFGVEKVAGSPARLDVSPLVAILKNNDLSICHIAGIVLNRLGWSPETDEQKAWYWTALNEWGKCSTLGDPAVEPLIQVLQSAEPYRRVNAAQALGTIGSDRAVGALIAAQDKNTDIFTVLAEALATSGNERAVKPLVAALHDIDRYPAAAKALVKLYASGRLDMKKKQAILAQRELIIRGQHEDYYQTKHHDYEGRGLSSDPTDCHSDESYRTNHQDINVPGEEFSL